MNPTESAPPPRRNLIVFLCDQLRCDYLSLYGCTGVPTPNLDRLAARGVVFDRAISQSPVCCPSRATMMSGRYVSDHGAWTNDMPCRPGLTFLPERLNDLGYRTGAFGKLHHAPIDDVRGFTTHHLFEEGRLGEREPYLQWLKQRHPEVTELWNHDRQQFQFDDEDYYEHWIASRAIDFIEAESSQPLMAWVSFQGPHGPYDPPASVAGSCDPTKLPDTIDPLNETFMAEVLASRCARMSAPFKDEDARNRLRVAYAEMIVFIDQQIGRVLEALERSGQLEHTTILFSADHGEMLGDHGLEEKGPFPYRQHLEVPMLIAQHPSLVDQVGTRSDALVGTIDLPGTLLDLAGDPEPIGQSRSLLASLGLASSETAHPISTPASSSQAPITPPREVIFSEFGDCLKVAESAQHRFGYYPFTQDMFLYDPIQDPEMLRNLANDPAYVDVVQRMLQHVVDFQLIAKGVRIEAHDLVQSQQRGLAAKDPHYADRMPLVFALSQKHIEQLTAAGLDATYNQAFEHRRPAHGYWPAYWE